MKPRLPIKHLSREAEIVFKRTRAGRILIRGIGAEGIRESRPHLHIVRGTNDDVGRVQVVGMYVVDINPAASLWAESRHGDTT